MALHRIVRGCVAGILTIAAAWPAAAADPAVQTEVVELSPDAFDQQLAGQPTVSFVVLPTGELGAADGTVVPLKQMPRHLKRTKADKNAYYLLWIVKTEQLPLARAAVESIAAYGATKFAVRRLPPTKEPREPNTANPSQKKVLILSGQPNPASLSAKDPLPSFAGRTEHLRPGVLPARVRCKFAPDAAVNQAAANAERLLLGAGQPDLALLGDMIFLQPGMWKHCANDRRLASASGFTSGIQLRQETLKLEGKLLRTAEERGAAAERSRSLIAADGGGRVRALTTQEMDEWWTFIATDIEEPVFLVASKGGKYRFVAGFDSGGRLNVLDELNALPSQH